MKLGHPTVACGNPRALVRLLCLAPCFVLAGCPSPNLYGTARTVPQGKFSFTVAQQAVGFIVDEKAVSDSDWYETTVVPTIPSFRVRLGLADRLDVAYVQGPTSFGAELKYNFLRSPFIDLAFAPGFQSVLDSSDTPGDSFEAHYLALPAVIDFNLHKRLSIVLTPGINFAWSSGNLQSTEFFGNGTSARLGLGVNIRLFRFLALQPEITALLPVSDQPDGTQLRYHFGVGFSFLNGPDFADVQ